MMFQSTGKGDDEFVSDLFEAGGEALRGGGGGEDCGVED